MKIQKIEIKNIRGVESLKQDINGHNLIAIGKNGVGKSSVIDTLFETLQSKYSQPNSVLKGKRDGTYKYDLGEWEATFTFKPEQKSPSMELVTKNGQKVPQARSALTSKVGILDFDIMSWLKKSDNEKLKYIFDHVDLGIGIEEIANLEAERKDHYTNRTIVNAKVKDLQKSINPITELDKENAEKEVIDISELFKKHSTHTALNEKIEGVKKRMDDRSERIQELVEQVKDLQSKNSEAEKFLKENKVVDLTEIEKEIEKAELINETISEARKQKSLFEENKRDLENAIEDQTYLNERIEEIDEIKRNCIIEGLNIPGLDYDGERFTFEGLYLQELNEAKQHIIGIQIGAKQLKELRVMRFTANDLDNDSLKEVFEFGAKNDIQFFVEQMDRNTDRLKIEVVEK